jgi:hypothetical protein
MRKDKFILLKKCSKLANWKNIRFCPFHDDFQVIEKLICATGEKCRVIQRSRKNKTKNQSKIYLNVNSNFVFYLSYSIKKGHYQKMIAFVCMFLIVVGHFLLHFHFGDIFRCLFSKSSCKLKPNQSTWPPVFFLLFST